MPRKHYVKLGHKWSLNEGVKNDMYTPAELVITYMTEFKNGVFLYSKTRVQFP